MFHTGRKDTKKIPTGSMKKYPNNMNGAGGKKLPLLFMYRIETLHHHRF
jgi:hypothetical protein